MMFFESIKIQNGIIQNLKYHSDRVNKTRKDIFNQKDYIDLQKYIKNINNNIIKCRILYSKKILSISYQPYTQRNISSFQIVYDNNIDYKYKLNNRDNINKLFSQKGKSDEILIVKNGLLADSSISNVAILDNDIWITPKIPLLNGTFRENMIENQKIIPQNVTLKQIKQASKIALMNAMIGFYIIHDFKIRI